MMISRLRDSTMISRIILIGETLRYYVLLKYSVIGVRYVILAGRDFIFSNYHEVIASQLGGFRW